MSEFFVVIPARHASTRLPGKPLADIGGLPMVVWVARRARAAGASAVLVATDDERVRRACAAHGVEVAMTAADHASGTDRVAEVARQRGWPEQAVVVNVQGDEPLIDPGAIRLVAESLHRRPDIAMATVAYPLDSLDDLLDPAVVKVVTDRLGRALYFSRAPIPWARGAFPEVLPPGHPALQHVGLYAYRAGFLLELSRMEPVSLEAVESLEQLRVLAHGHAILVAVAAGSPAPAVDTPDDLARVQALVRARPDLADLN